MHRCLLAAALSVVSVSALADEVEVRPERRELFSMLLEMNGCRMHNFEPSETLVNNIEANDFSREEVRAIGRQMMEDGSAERNGDYFVLKTEGCP